jgi:glycosyltransferase involved in cell wall biosynthesis
MSSVRVLHVYSGNLWGGIESFLVTLARLAALVPGMQSEFALCFDGRLRRELVQTGAAVLDLGPVRTRAPCSVLRARRALVRHLVARKFDVVVCHSVWSHAMFGHVPRALGVPVVFYLHDLVRPRHWLERWASLHPPPWSIANSEFTRSSLGQLFAERDSSVVRYPIESRQVTLSNAERLAVRDDLGASPETVLIAHVSRMQPWKGHPRLLRALSRMAPAAPWLCLVIGGAQRAEEHRYREQLEAQARALGVTSRVSFLGQRDDVPRLLAASDIHCQANAEPEPFGIVFVEALLAGLPVVTFAEGGPCEIVTEDVGCLVGDDAALADELERLVDDPRRRRRLGAAGPARAQELCDPGSRLAELAEALGRVASGSAFRPTTA